MTDRILDAYAASFRRPDMLPKVWDMVREANPNRADELIAMLVGVGRSEANSAEFRAFFARGVQHG